MSEMSFGLSWYIQEFLSDWNVQKRGLDFFAVIVIVAIILTGSW